MNAREKSMDGIMSVNLDLASRVEIFFLRNRKRFVYVHLAMLALLFILFVIPAFLPLPSEVDGLFTSFTLFARFAVWGVWFPFLFLSVIFFGRIWCGVFCPQGALGEYANKIGLNMALPKWLTYGWVPISSFIFITITGQVLGVRDYPLPALGVFVGTTAVAVIAGFLFARGRRVWCRYLCPVGPLLGVFARLGAASFERVNGAKTCLCPAFINTQTKTSSSNCIECFRCVEPAGLRLKFRRPGKEIEEIRLRDADIWEVLFLFSATGLALGAFHWQANPVYIHYKQTLGGALLGMGLADVMGWGGPWWVMVNYPEAGEVFNLLDVISISSFMLISTLLVTACLFALTSVSSLMRGDGVGKGVAEIGYVYAPIALISLVIGLGGMLFEVSGGAPYLKKALFIWGGMWSAWLGFKVVGLRPALAPLLLGTALVGFLWQGALF